MFLLPRLRLLRPNLLPTRMCVTFRHPKRTTAQAHGRMAARALATRVVKKEAGYSLQAPRFDYQAQSI